MEASLKINIARLLLGLVLTLSAFVQLTVVSRTVVEYPMQADAGDYFSYAFNVQHYDVYSSFKTWAVEPSKATPPPDKMRSPGYPAFLMMVGLAEPTDAYFYRVALAQAALGVLSVLLVYLVAVTLLSRALGLVVATLTAISPHLANASTYFLTESLFLFLLLAATLALVKATQSRSYLLFAAAGLLWGLCSLVRPTTLFFPILLLLAAVGLPAARSFARPALLAIACFAAVLAPWAIRNHSVPDTPGTNIMVNTLAHGSYPGFMYKERPETFGFPYRFDPAIEENTKNLSSVLKSIAKGFISQPLEYARWYLLGKPYYFLSLNDVQSVDIYIYPTTRTPYLEDVRFALMRKLSLAIHWPLMILGLAGAVLLWARPDLLRLDSSKIVAGRIVAALVLYAIAFHVVVAPFPRYAIPFRPFMYALAALSAGAFWNALRAHQRLHANRE